MGGAVSSGRDNTELIDNLMGGNYIRSRDVERVFRALDRGDYLTPECRDQAYKDLAWRNGPLHMSAPCIYSEVMEGLELKPGLSFLNVGSGTGYLSTLVGLIIGASGINHGIENQAVVVEYANKKLAHFMENSPTLDEFDFCEPKFICGNGLRLAPLATPYDRVYCGAGCPEEFQNYFQQLIKVGGILIMPMNDNLLQVKRTAAAEWHTRSLLNVSFAALRMPTRDEAQELIRLEEQTPARLQALARSVIRGAVRGAVRARNPQVREPPPRAPPAKRVCPRRICIPVDDEDSDLDAIPHGLHDLDRESGGAEMNALLSLVLSMSHHRTAGALRVSALDSDTSSSEAEVENDRISPLVRLHHEPEQDEDGNETGGRNVLMFEFRDGNGVVRHANPPIPLRRPRMRRRAAPHAHSHSDDDWGTDGGDGDTWGEGGDTDNEGNEHAGDQDASGQQQLEDDAHNETGADHHAEAKSSDSKVQDEVSIEKEADLKIEDSASKDTPVVKKEIKSILKKTFKEKEVINPLKDRSYKLAEIPLDDIDIDKQSEEDSISGCKPSTSHDEFVDKTEKETEHSDKPDSEKEYSNTTEEKEILDSTCHTEECTEHAANDREYIDYEDRSAREKEFLDCSDLSEKETRLRRSSRKSRDATKSRTRARSNRCSRRADDEEGVRNPAGPAEGRATLGKEAGGAAMEWECCEPADGDAKERSSGDDVTESDISKKEEKRHKLDSGIGEENTPSGGSASHNSGDSEQSEQSEQSRDDTDDDDEGCDEDLRGRRRRQKRGHLSTRSSSSTDEETARPRLPRAPRPRRRDQDALRRDQLSLSMKRALKELPLPHALKKYVNYNRSYDL